MYMSHLNIIWWCFLNIYASRKYNLTMVTFCIIYVYGNYNIGSKSTCNSYATYKHSLIMVKLCQRKYWAVGYVIWW